MGVHGPHKRNVKPANVDDAMVSATPDPPERLGEIGRDTWYQLSGELARRGRITESDAILLGVVCELMEKWKRLSDQAERHPDPAPMRMLLACAKQIQSGLNDLTLTRRSKSAAGVVDSKPVFPWA